MGRVRKEWLEWFRVDRDLVENQKLYALAVGGGWSTDKALGRLIRLWAWVAKHAPDGVLTDALATGLDNHLIDHEQLLDHSAGHHCPCCSDPDVDADSLKYGRRLAPFIEAGFLDPTGEPGEDIIVHDWSDMNGYALRERERDRDRKSLERLNAGGIPGEVRRNSGGTARDSHRNGDGTDTETD